MTQTAKNLMTHRAHCKVVECNQCAAADEIERLSAEVKSAFMAGYWAGVEHSGKRASRTMRLEAWESYLLIGPVPCEHTPIHTLEGDFCEDCDEPLTLGDSKHAIDRSIEKHSGAYKTLSDDSRQKDQK